MIDKLVQDLPEVYQPVFGHPQLSTAASRPCADRLQQIQQIYATLEQLLKRPLKVLDLGCAQGFFSLSLAQRGAKVHGVDYLGKNIALCHALAQENPSLQISFAEGRIEDVVPALQPDQYDLVLGLSVFHHLVHANGASSVKALLTQLAQAGGALVLEMALQTEPLYWGPAQPADPRELIHDIGFVHLVAHHGTHLAGIPRPLYIASNRYWILGDVAGQFEYWSFLSHAHANGVHSFGRRYFVSKDFVLKLYRLDDKNLAYNKDDFHREIGFLKEPAYDFVTPRFFSYGEHATEAWIVMQKLPGRSLLDLIREGSSYDSRKILLAVLQQLAALEAAGLHHNDVRTWNVLVDTPSEAVHLIDYGSIAATPKDCAWPGNLFLSFFIFVKEVATGQADTPVPLRTISISPFSLPEPYRAWALSLWQQPMNEWTFRQLHQSLLAWPDNNTALTSDQQPMFVWMQAMEEAAQVQKQHAQHQSQHLVSTAQLNQALDIAQAAQAQVQQLQQQVAQTAQQQMQQALARAEQAESLAAIEIQDSQLKAQQALQVAQTAQQQMQQALARAEQAESLANSYLQDKQYKEAELVMVQQELLNVHQANHHHWQLAEIRQSQISAMQRSWSWRLTWPVRLAAGLVLRPLQTARPLTNQSLAWSLNTFQKPLATAMAWVLAKPQLTARINRWLVRWPHLRGHLVTIARQQGVVHQAFNFSGGYSQIPTSSTDQSHTLAHLSPRARQIYADLKAAIAKQHKGDH